VDATQGKRPVDVHNAGRAFPKIFPIRDDSEFLRRLLRVCPVFVVAEASTRRGFVREMSWQATQLHDEPDRRKVRAEKGIPVCDAAGVDLAASWSACPWRAAISRQSVASAEAASA
jgi:hypothetical protein